MAPCQHGDRSPPDYQKGPGKGCRTWIRCIHSVLEMYLLYLNCTLCVQFVPKPYHKLRSAPPGGRKMYSVCTICTETVPCVPQNVACVYYIHTFTRPRIPKMCCVCVLPASIPWTRRRGQTCILRVLALRMKKGKRHPGRLKCSGAFARYVIPLETCSAPPRRYIPDPGARLPPDRHA